MKKFLVVALVVAMACLSSAAFAAEVTVNGMVDVRSRMFENFDLNDTTGDRDNYTQTRYMMTIKVKGDNVKGLMSIWNDHDTWASNRVVSNGATNIATNSVKGFSTLAIREMWLDVMIPGTPVGLKAGQMVTSIGNAWFLRQGYGGVGAWVAYANVGPVTISLQDAKILEGGITTSNDDADLYSAVVSAKVGDMGTVGLDVSMLRDDYGVLVTPATGDQKRGRLYNFGLHANLKAGPANIKFEADYQNGYADTFDGAGSRGYRGYQIVLQPSVKAGIVTINMLAAMGSGDKQGTMAVEAYKPMLDIAQHYTLIYEYRRAGAGGRYNGFSNTTVGSIGVMAQVLPSLGIGADAYILRATERVNNSNDAGFEIDGKLNWKITKDVSWNWQAGYYKPGGAVAVAGNKDDCYGFQGILALSF